tara:strand:+ start:368 stop:553 length:186 start_codon:yes stop_codon:yes gene_type:complete
MKNVELPITVKQLAKEMGVTANSIMQKKKVGKFIEGVHYIKTPDNGIFFFRSEVRNWMLGA